MEVAQWRLPDWADRKGPNYVDPVTPLFRWAGRIVIAIWTVGLVAVLGEWLFGGKSAVIAHGTQIVNAFLLSSSLVGVTILRNRHAQPIRRWLDKRKREGGTETALVILRRETPIGRDFGFVEIRDGMLRFSGYMCDFRLSAQDVLMPEDCFSNVANDIPWVDQDLPTIGSRWHRIAWGFYLAADPEVKVFFGRSGQSPDRFREDLYRWKSLSPPATSYDSILPPLEKQSPDLGILGPVR